MVKKRKFVCSCVQTVDKYRNLLVRSPWQRQVHTGLMAQSSKYHLTHLLKHDSHSFHGGALGSYLAVDVQRSVQDLSHFICVDDGVVLGQISVQLLDLVLQILNICLESLWTHIHLQYIRNDTLEVFECG